MAGRDFLAGRRHALLADEMRVGKTPQAILACEAVGAREILVVCPAIAVTQWRAEFKRWWPGCREPVVMSYDRAKLAGKALTTRQWDVVIVDECHYAKNPATNRTKLVYGTGGLGWTAKRLWALSGTPAPKHAAELWPMLRAFGVTDLKYDTFARKFCYVQQGTDRIKGTKQAAIPELRAMLAKVMLRRKRSEVAPEIPPIDFQFLRVDATDASDLPTGTTPDTPPDSLQEVRIAVAKAKVLPLAREIQFALENDLLRQTVVFGWHVEPLVDLHRELGFREITAGTITGATSPAERQRIQQAFREGRIQVVIANIAAAGTAIDLSAAHHGYFLELDWVPGNNIQAANRLVSLQKNEPVSIDVVTSPGTVDDAVQKIVLRRAKEVGKIF